MKRIFIAIDISDEARKFAARHIENLRIGFQRVKVSWEKAEKMHLTLKFIGDADEFQLEYLFEIVEEIASRISNFKLQISETGIFPGNKNPRILHFGINGDLEILRRINLKLESECQKIGFSNEKRIFKPHLTIGRVREPQKAEELVANHLQTKIEPVEFEVSEIVIYESKLQPSGSIYSKLKTFPLKNNS